MALRAFQVNPSLGGFGNEAINTSFSTRPTISGDAFPQIVKELVDNAVDACSSGVDLAGGSPERRVYRRVRVKIEAEEFICTSCSDDEKAMDCLRITVSDNGVGMEDIDACVMVFSTNKNLGATKSKKKKKQTKGATKVNSASIDGHTSGRYGLGLTLCLLHAQHLVPGSVTCITSTTAASKHWVRSTYQVDMDADNVRCKKREELIKEDMMDCGTIVSLLVPGGEEAQQCWPRLAEYFARYQLSLDLSCSLEVLAPSLCRRPLMIRPPTEMERRVRMMKQFQCSSDEDNGQNPHWDGDDGCDNNDENDESKTFMVPSISKAARDRDRSQQEKVKKTALLCKAAEMYKGRSVSLKNVALEAHPIRRHGVDASRVKDCSMLEVGIIVFGPGSECHDSDHKEYRQNPNANYNPSKSASMQLIRVVNGIPLLDSSEALACGIVQKVSNHSSNFNSFGLDVSLKKLSESCKTSENNTPMFDVRDCAQVVPFFRESAHCLFERQDNGDQSSDGDIFDPEEDVKKRKKEKTRLFSLLPATLRLGEMMMIVHIRAKPSSLPLPTLSKGRLPLNDKGINDAIENSITSCLRSLQRTNPSLLLNAQQLKRVERDSKYVPAVAGAVASVISHSKRVGLYEHAVNVMSSWDDELRKWNIATFDKAIDSSQGMRAKHEQQETNPYASSQESTFTRVEVLRPLLERRLRFVVSEEFKETKKEKIRKQQKDVVASRKTEKVNQQNKKQRSPKPDDMNEDCLESDDSIESRVISRPLECRYSDFENETSSLERCKSVNSQFDVKSASNVSAVLGKVPFVNQSSAIFHSNDGFDSEDGVELVDVSPQDNNICKEDGMSTDDDWSEEYDMAVLGRFY